MSCNCEKTETFYKKVEGGREAWKLCKKCGKEERISCAACGHPLTVDKNGVCLVCGG